MDKIVTSMSKIDMIKYLNDYAYLNERYVEIGERGLFDSFSSFMYFNNRYKNMNPEYYNTMLRTYHFYINLRMYSILEDYFLNRDNLINNDDLNTFIHNCKFIEKPSNLNNKRLLELIRNSFNHLFGKNMVLSQNAKNIALLLEDTRYPRQISKGGKKEPLKMKFNIDYIHSLSNLISQNGKNVLFTDFDVPEDFDLNASNLYRELDKIKFEHYYFDKKLDDSTLNQFKSLNNTILLNSDENINNSNLIHQLGDSINVSSKFGLSYNQKKKAVELIKKYREIDPELFDENIYNVVYFILNDLIPVPGLKMNTFYEYLYYLSLTTEENQYSFNEILRLVSDCINDENDKLKNMKKIDQINLIRHMANSDFIKAIPYMIYIDAVINSLCEEDEIIINDRKYDRNRLRNSLVHCRWFIGVNNIIHFFDANPKNMYDYDLKDIASIKLKDLILWADTYLNEKISKDENHIYKLSK